jgi:type VI secretion system protein ImpG
MPANSQRDFLPYYHKELTYLRKQGAAFAERYPKVMGRLQLGANECADPQVERLLESFAFLTGRIQHQLDSEFPEITSALLGVLYPQLINPVPAMTVAHFEVDPDQGQLTTGHLIPRHTPLLTESPEGITCRFRTCYPVTLWPVKVAEAAIESTDRFDFLDTATDVAAVLRLRIVSQSGSLQEFALQRLRFYLRGNRAVATTLYELLTCAVRQVVIQPDSGTRPVRLPPETIIPVGFGPEEAVLPYPPHAHPGYRLLQEYFNFPEKFLFIDVDHLDTHHAQQTFDLLFLLDRVPPKWLSVGPQTFTLGCTPIINLFHKTSEPIRLDHRQTEYRLVADLRRERWTEIHSIHRVSASSHDNELTQTIEPFYSYTHAMASRHHKAFWHARRVPASHPNLAGTELRLSFVDLDFNPHLPPMQTLYAHTLCTNRDLADNLNDETLLQIEEAVPQRQIMCLHKPTQPLTPPLGGATLWRLISHLSLNHLSLNGGPGSRQALCEILKLYNIDENPSAHQHIRGIRKMDCQPAVRRLGTDTWRGFCRGLEITLELDHDCYEGSSAVLFASVLNHFFALYASVNAFTQLVMKHSDREGIVKRWPPMAGEQLIL